MKSKQKSSRPRSKEASGDRLTATLLGSFLSYLPEENMPDEKKLPEENILGARNPAWSHQTQDDIDLL